MAYTAADIRDILDGKKKLTAVAEAKPAPPSGYHAYTPLHVSPVAAVVNPHFAPPSSAVPPPAVPEKLPRVAPPIYRPSGEVGPKGFAPNITAPQAAKAVPPPPRVAYNPPFAVNLPVYAPPAPKPSYSLGAAKPPIYTNPVLPGPIVSYTPMAAANPDFKQAMFNDAISRAEKKKAATAANDARAVDISLPENQRVMRYLNAGTRLNERELEDANRIIDDFYNAYIIGQLDMNPEVKLSPGVQRQFNRISALSNKVNSGGALVTGAVSTIGGDWIERKKADNVRAALERRPNDEILREQLDDFTLRSTHQNARTQHPIAYTGGMFAGEAAKYAGAAKVLDAIPLVAKAAQTAGNIGSKLLGGKVSAKVLTRLVEGRAVDLPFDVVNAAAQSENPEDFAKNLGVSTVTGLGTDIGLEAVGKLWRMARGAAGKGVSANFADSEMPTPEEVKAQRRAGLKTLEQQRLEREAAGKAVSPAVGEPDYFAMPKPGETSAQVNLSVAAQDVVSGRGFMEQVTEVMQGKNPDAPLVIGKTPSILKQFGASDHMLTMKADAVRKIAYPAGYMEALAGRPLADSMNYHNLGFYALEHLPEQLENPVAILKSSTQPNSQVIFTEFLDEKNRPVMAALHLDKNGQLGISNEIASMYGRNGFENFIAEQRKRGNILYEDKKRILHQLPANGLQLPEVEAVSDPIYSISARGKNVNSERGNILYEDKKRTLHQLPGNGLQLPAMEAVSDPIYSISGRGKNVNSKRGNILYEDKKRTLHQLPANGLQLPEVEAVSDPIYSISRRGKDVNSLEPFADTNFLTEEQIKAKRRAGLKTKEQRLRENRISAGIEQPGGNVSTYAADSAQSGSEILTEEQIKANRRAGLKTKEQRRLEGETKASGALPTTGKNARITGQDFSNYMETGSRKKVLSGKQSYLSEHGDPILKSKEEQVKFITEAIEGKNKGIAVFGKVGEQLQQQVERLSENTIDLSGKYLELDAGHLRHAYLRHSEQAELPISREQFKSLPDLILNYDDVLEAGRDSTGKAKILLGKKINGHSIIVELVSDSRKSIFPVTVYNVDTATYLRKFSNKISSGVRELDANELTPSVRPKSIPQSTAYTSNIYQAGEKSNSEIAKANRRAELKTLEQQRQERRIAAGIEQPSSSSGSIPPKGAAATAEPEIPKGFKERGYAETVRKKSTLPEEIKNEFVSSPEIYKVLSNEQTQKTADDIMALGIDEARNQFDRLVSGKQPAAIPLGNQLAKAYIEQGNKDAAVSVVRTMAEKLTQSGQFSQAAAIGLLKSDPPTALRYLQQQIERMNVEGRAKLGKHWKNFELSADDIERMSGIDAGDTEKIKAAFEAVGKRISKEYPATAKEKVIEFSHVMMLLNPRTQIKNLAANVLMLPMQSISAKVSALGQQAWRLVNPKFKPTQAILVSRKSRKLSKEIYKTVKDQIGAGTQEKWENAALDSIRDKDVFKIRKYSPTNLINKSLPESAQMERSITEQVRRFTYKLLDMGDTPFVKKNFVNRLASYVEAQGFKSVKEVPPEAISVAISEAMKATFKDDNTLTELLQVFKRKTGIAGETVMPFSKTPANVTMRSIDFSPAGIASAVVKQAKSGGDPAQFIDQLAKGLTGTAAIVLGVVLHRKGLITGALSDNKREAAFQKQQGMLPFAFKVLGKYYSYDWAQPAATSLLIGAVIDQALQSEDGLGLDDVPGTVMKAVFAYGDTLLEQSTLQNFRDILGGYDGPAENITNEFTQTPQRLIPSALGATTRSIDGTVRQTYSKDSMLRTQLDSAKSKIPGLSQTLPIAYDTWGRPISRGDSGAGRAFSQFISPGNTGIANKTPLDGEILRLFEKTGTESVFPPKTGWSLLYDGKTYRLDNRSHSEHQKTTGTIAYNTLEDVFADPVYQRLSDDEKLSLIGKVYKIANDQARGQYLRSQGVDYETKDGSVQKALEAQEAGIPFAQYLLTKAAANADGRGSVTQEEMKSALDSASLTNEQRGYLYKGQGWESNPYAADTTGELVAIMPKKPRQKPKESKVAGLTDEQFTKYDDTIDGFKAEHYPGTTNEITASRKQKVYDYVMALPIPYEKRVGLYRLYYKDAGGVVIEGQKMPKGFKPW